MKRGYIYKKWNRKKIDKRTPQKIKIKCESDAS